MPDGGFCVLLGENGRSEVVLRLGQVRPQPCGLAEVIQGDIDIAAIELPRADSVVSLPAFPVMLQRVAPELVLIFPNSRVAVAPKGKQTHHRRRQNPERRFPFHPGQVTRPHPHPDYERHDSNHRDVEKMVGHPTHPHIRHRHESQHGQERNQIKTHAHQRMPAPGFSTHPKNSQHPREHGPSEELGELGRVGGPLRVDGQEQGGPEDFREIKEDRHAGDGESRVKPANRDGLVADRPTVLEMERHQAEQKRHQKKRRGVPEVAPGDPIAPPPDIKQHHDREHHDRAFGQHRGQEKSQRRPVKNPPPRVLKPHEETPRRQKKRQREGVF